MLVFVRTHDTDDMARATARYGIRVDHGWSWMVALAVCMTGFVSCLPYMAGLFTLEFSQEFHYDTSVTSLCGSVINAAFCFAGNYYFYDRKTSL